MNDYEIHFKSDAAELVTQCGLDESNIREAILTAALQNTEAQCFTASTGECMIHCEYSPVSAGLITVVHIEKPSD